MSPGDKGTDVCLLLERVARDESPGFVDKPVYKFLVYASFNEEPRTAKTDLALV